MKRARSGKKPTIQCTRVRPTSYRPGAEGTYIVRLSSTNQDRLRVGNGAYLNVSYGKASVLARLSVDKDLDDKTIRIDQTLRTALCLEKIMQGLRGKKELVYRLKGRGALKLPVVIQGSNFPGPTLLARLVKQQYLICIVHHALPTDMETPLARLSKSAMDAIGIQPGDKVLLISETARKALRCFELDPSQLPLKSMRKDFKPPCPYALYKDLRLPWVTMDMQTRIGLNPTGLDHYEVKPWYPILVGRDPRHAVITEFAALAFTLAVGAVGGAIVVDVRLGQVAILAAGFIAVFALIWAKIRSRI